MWSCSVMASPTCIRDKGDKMSVIEKFASETPDRVAYRMLLRKLLFAKDGAALYFHPMSAVVSAAEAGGVRLVKQLPEHAFTVLVFERRG